jgi:hypothetical protein
VVVVIPNLIFMNPPPCCGDHTCPLLLVGFYWTMPVFRFTFCLFTHFLAPFSGSLPPSALPLQHSPPVPLLMFLAPCPLTSPPPQPCRLSPFTRPSFIPSLTASFTSFFTPPYSPHTPHPFATSLTPSLTPSFTPSVTPFVVDLPPSRHPGDSGYG